MSPFPRARRTVLTTVAAAAATAALAVSPAAQASKPTPTPSPTPVSSAGSSSSVLADCVHHRVRPHRVFIACGDGALFLQVRHYRYWHAGEAVGRGAVYADDCDPNCADGTFHRTAARIRYFRAVHTLQGTVFSRAAVRWHLPNGKHGRDVYWLPTRPEG